MYNNHVASCGVGFSLVEHMREREADRETEQSLLLLKKLTNKTFLLGFVGSSVLGRSLLHYKYFSIY